MCVCVCVTGKAASTKGTRFTDVEAIIIYIYIYISRAPRWITDDDNDRTGRCVHALYLLFPSAHYPSTPFVTPHSTAIRRRYQFSFDPFHYYYYYLKRSRDRAFSPIYTRSPAARILIEYLHHPSSGAAPRRVFGARRRRSIGLSFKIK